MTRFAAVVALFALAGGARAQVVPTLKAKTRIVVTDVVVTDKHGSPVKNLQASDFAVAENGAPQTISHFEAHMSLSAEDAAKLPPMPKLEPNIFTNYSTAPANGPLTVLLFDALNTHDRIPPQGPANILKNQSIVRLQMLKYLAVSHPGIRMELFNLNADLQLLHGFTYDQEALRAALMNPKNETKISQTSSMMPNSLCDPESATVGGDGVSAGELRGMAECAKDEERSRSLNTLNAMEALARYMGGLPGRKNLLWFSTSFSIPSDKNEVSDKLHETMALFAKNQVTVYPIGAGGLMLGGRGALARNESERITMEMMAEDTGGKGFANTNDIAGAIEQAVDHGSNYYTLTYSPTNREAKGDFRKVQVKLAQKGYTLAYRPGYYADEEKPLPKVDVAADAGPVTAPAAAPDPAKVALHAAMEFGAPQPADVVFKVAVNPATGHVEDVVAHGNSLSPKVQAPFERYVISVAALPTNFTFTRTAAGKVHVGAQLVTCVYSADGALINAASIRIDNDIDDARYQTIMANGMKFQQEISVPVKGDSFLRIGVEDLATSRVGVVEIPVETVAKLKPLGDAK